MISYDLSKGTDIVVARLEGWGRDVWAELVDASDPVFSDLGMIRQVVCDSRFPVPGYAPSTLFYFAVFRGRRGGKLRRGKGPVWVRASMIGVSTFRGIGGNRVVEKRELYGRVLPGWVQGRVFVVGKC